MLVLHCLMAEQIGKGNWNMGGISFTDTNISSSVTKLSYA